MTVTRGVGFGSAVDITAATRLVRLVPSADPYLRPNALSFGGEKRTCSTGIAPLMEEPDGGD
jgi:hypothetical protein